MRLICLLANLTHERHGTVAKYLQVLRKSYSMTHRHLEELSIPLKYIRILRIVTSLVVNLKNLYLIAEMFVNEIECRCY